MTRPPVTAADLDTARTILGLAASRDSRIPRPDHPDAAAVAAALAEDIAGLNPRAAVAAVGIHYCESTDRIMAGHIRAIVRRTHGGAVPATPSESLATAKGSRGDIVAAPHPEDLRPPPPGPPPRNGNQALESAFRDVVARRALPAGTSAPTGFEPRRSRAVRGRAARITTPLPAMAPTTVPCFAACPAEVPIPAGWDPANPASKRLYCPAHEHLDRA